MKKPLRTFFALLLCALCLSGGVAQAADSVRRSSKPTAGVEAAQALSMITGVAISPLLGIGGIGAWKYFKTPPEERAVLAWYAQPWFWVPALLLVALVFVKDTFGTVLPVAVKKPFDVAEAIENKISGLIAAGAFVPLIAVIFKAVEADGAWFDETGVAMVGLSPLLNILTVPLALIAFTVVFLVSHVINVLILISPFSTVDAALKTARLALLSTVAVTSFANPYFGAVWSLLIVLVCWFLAGWAFRLFVFGSVFTWDYGTFRRSRFKAEPEHCWIFTARRIDDTPIRTYGTLTRGAQGELLLNYRPWLLLPRRTLTLPAGKYLVGRGLVYSEIIRQDNETTEPVITLPPRYRGHEEELSSIHLLGGVQETGVVKGMKTFWRWIKELFGFQPEPSASA